MPVPVPVGCVACVCCTHLGDSVRGPPVGLPERSVGAPIANSIRSQLLRPTLLTRPTKSLAYSEGDDQIGHGEGPSELAKLYPGNLVTKHKHTAEGHRPLPGDKGEVEALVAAVKAFIVAECPE